MAEHVYLPTNALEDGMREFGSEELKTSASRLDENSVQISRGFSPGNTDYGDEILVLWRSHIDNYFNYALAAKNNDEDKMDLAERNLDNFPDQLSSMISGNDTNLDNELGQMFTGHISMVLDSIDAYLRGDYETYTKLNHQGFVDTAVQAEKINSISGR